MHTTSNAQRYGSGLHSHHDIHGSVSNYFLLHQAEVMLDMVFCSGWYIGDLSVRDVQTILLPWTDQGSVAATHSLWSYFY